MKLTRLPATDGAVLTEPFNSRKVRLYGHQARMALETVVVVRLKALDGMAHGRVGSGSFEPIE